MIVKVSCVPVCSRMSLLRLRVVWFGADSSFFLVLGELPAVVLFGRADNCALVFLSRSVEAESPFENLSLSQFLRFSNIVLRRTVRPELDR